MTKKVIAPAGGFAQTIYYETNEGIIIFGGYMEKEIIDKIYHLYRSHIVTLIIFVLLCCVGILISVGVMKFDLLKSKTKRILLFSTVLLCSVLLPVLQLFQMSPICADYQESS